MFTSKYIKFGIAAVTALGLIYSSLAHARKLLHKQDANANGAEQVCMPDVQEPLRLPCANLDRLAGTNFLPPQRFTTTNTPAPPLTSITIWHSQRQQCGHSGRHKRRQLIYYLFPKLPDLTLNLNNFSVRLDIDGRETEASFPLALQIGYRSCW